MESDSKEKIVVLLERLIILLRENDEEWWASWQEALLDNYVNLTHSKTKLEAVNDIQNMITGGMGSLSDLIFHKDGKPIWEESRQLAKLRHDLYYECQLIQYGRLSARLLDSFIGGRPYSTYQIDE